MNTNNTDDAGTALEIIDPVWIPMPDGARLAARIVMPQQRDARIPAVLEYLPYRRADGTLRRDMVRHPYLAHHGFAAVRVDMRGSGDSDGVLYGEYLPQEQDDAVAVIAWLAAQPWCNGNVGMFGISWGDSMPCKWRHAGHLPSKPSFPSVRPMIAMPTMCTTWAGACWPLICWLGHR